MSWLELHLFGAFHLIREGNHTVEFRSEKERALLAYLAMESQRPHSREVLAGLLWPDHPEETANNNLRVTLHRLRQALGEHASAQPLIDVSREAILLRQNGGLWVDALRFQELLTRAELHAPEKPISCSECVPWYAEATRLYRGEFLQGVYPADSLPFSEWALLKREHLHRQALQALYYLAVFHRRRGELDQALDYARRQLELEPWREEAHCQVMKTLALRGERSAALHQYELCRQVLMDELGVETAQETRRLYERIVAARERSLHILPQQNTSFFGRKAELNRVTEYLANPDCRLLTILGPGGMGKSRLAMRVAEGQVYNYLHGVCLVQLASVPSPADLVRAIAEALDLPLRTTGDTNAQLLDFLREKEMLLVLDNYEHLLKPAQPPDTSFLEELLKNAPDLRLLVTSRQRLNMRQEWIFPLQGLSYPGAAFNGAVEKFEAVELFLHSASRVDPGFQPDRTEEPSIVRICQLLEGVPLALELAAAWTWFMPPEQIASEIERDLDFLASTYPDLPERQRSLRATFDYSFHLLSPEEQQALVRLSHFPTSFERDAAAQVAGASLAILSALCDRSLVEQVRTDNSRYPVRYRMHELIRQFGREKLKQDETEFDNTKARQRAYYMSFLIDRDDKVMGGSQPYQAVQDVGGEIENVRQALEQAIVECNLHELGHSFDILMFFYEIRGLFAEAEQVFSRIRRCFEDNVHESRADHEETGRFLGRARMYHGWYCMHLARFDEAIDLTQQGISACLQCGDRKGYGMGLNSLGLLAMNQGQYQQAHTYLEESHNVALELGDIWWESGTCGNLAILALMQGDLARGTELCQQQLELITRLGDEWGMAGSLDTLGDLAAQQGDLELAEKRFRQALQLREKLNQRWRYALTLNRLGGIAYRRQDYSEAKSDYQESLSVLRDFGERLHLASTLARYGEVCTALGEYDQAREALQDSLNFARQVGADAISLEALLRMAELLLKEGETGQACETLAALCENPSLGHEDQERARSLLAETRS